MFADPCRDFPLTPRAGSPDSLQIIATDSNGNGTTLFQTDLAPFVGVWVEAFEQITYSHTGKYSVVIKTLNGGTTLLSYSNSNIDMWRTGTTFCRPKWGIYRSLNGPSFLRDEQLLGISLLQNDGTTSDPANFNSREAASNRPQLVVQP